MNMSRFRCYIEGGQVKARLDDKFFIFENKEIITISLAECHAIVSFLS